MSASSSTTKIRPLGSEELASSGGSRSGMHGLSSHWKLDAESGAGPGAAVHLDIPAVFAHNAVTDGKPQTSSLARGLGREKRIVNAGKVLGRDARAVVSHLNVHETVFAPSLDREGSTRFHGVPRIQEKIKKYLLQLARVSLNGRQCRIERQLHLDGRDLQLVLNQGQCVLNHA